MMWRPSFAGARFGTIGMTPSSRLTPLTTLSGASPADALSEGRPREDLAAGLSYLAAT